MHGLDYSCIERYNSSYRFFRHYYDRLLLPQGLGDLYFQVDTNLHRHPSNNRVQNLLTVWHPPKADRTQKLLLLAVVVQRAYGTVRIFLAIG